MEKYRIEKLKVLKDKNYIPTQMLGNKRIVRTMETMNIKECEEYIKDYQENQSDGNKGNWILVKLS